MKRLAIIAGLIGAPLAAQEASTVTAPNYASMSNAELRAAWDGLEEDAPACAVRLPILQEFARRHTGNVELERTTLNMGMWCAYEAKNYPSAYEQLLALEKADGEIHSELALHLATVEGDDQAVLARARTMLLSETAENQSRLVPALYWFARNDIENKTISDNLRSVEAQVAASPALENFDPDLQQTYLISGVRIAAEGGDIALGEKLLEKVNRPDNLTPILASNKYADLWPAAEARAGASYATITAAFRAEALARRAAAPTNATTLNSAARALYQNGDFAELIELVDTGTQRPNLAETIVEDEAWALNLKAYALDALGRHEDADRVFDFLVGEPLQAKGWSVNFAINRALRLVGHGRWNEGLAATELAKGIAEKSGTTYARMLVAGNFICALDALGRSAEAQEHLDYIGANAAEHPHIAAAAFQCLGDDDRAEQLILDGLRDDEKREGLLGELQAVEFDLFYTSTILPHPRDLLATHPALREEFFRHARLIPVQFYPAASLKRRATAAEKD